MTKIVCVAIVFSPKGQILTSIANPNFVDKQREKKLIYQTPEGLHNVETDPGYQFTVEKYLAQRAGISGIYLKYYGHIWSGTTLFKYWKTVQILDTSRLSIDTDENGVEMHFPWFFISPTNLSRDYLSGSLRLKWDDIIKDSTELQIQFSKDNVTDDRINEGKALEFMR